MPTIPGYKPQKKMKPINRDKSVEGSLFPLHEAIFSCKKRILMIHSI